MVLTRPKKESDSQMPVELLESGTSLAEQEHDGQDLPSPSSKHSSSTTPSSSSHQTPTKFLPEAKRSQKEILESIEELRTEVANDLLLTARAGTFTSPFEVPAGAVPIVNTTKTTAITKKKDNDSSSRYLEVPLVYCDQTASNRTLMSIESYMQRTCLPLYGNTHTNTSITGAQSTAFVAEARQIVAESCNARITGKASLDVVLFTGSGSTGCIELLIDCMGLKHACSNDNNNNNSNKPIVFVGPHEHHSNIVPWRETGCEIVSVPEDVRSGDVDYDALEKLLQQYSPSSSSSINTDTNNDRLKMGTFTAASNINGKVTDVNRIAATLHKYGALAFFDYATASPYMGTMDMNPSPTCQYPTAFHIAKDAIFLSPHKMIGGIGTPGVLIVKKNLVNQQNAPSRSGGGTVFYVSNTHHRFLSNRIDRFEGGTPNVAGIFRVGLTFLFKRQVEQRYHQLVQASSTSNRISLTDDNKKQKDEIEEEPIPASLQAFEYQTYDRVANYLRQHAPNLVLLDGRQLQAQRDADDPSSSSSSSSARNNLPIFSFLIKCGKRFLHYNYVCAILNDVFGIQSRGGCQCAGPYSQRLLGLVTTTSSTTKSGSNGNEEGDGSEEMVLEVPNEQNKAIEHALLHYKERAELLRPGYTRLSLPFKGLRTEEVDYVVKSVAWTAKNGWALMCNYRCNHRTGEWRHAARQGKPLGKTERKWLSHYDRTISDLQDTTNSFPEDFKVSCGSKYNQALANADCILKAAKSDQRSIAEAMKMNDVGSTADFDELEKLRWFTYPKEVASYLSRGIQNVPGTNTPELYGGIKPLACASSECQSREASSKDDENGNGMTIDKPPVRERKRKQATLDGESSEDVQEKPEDVDDKNVPRKKSNSILKSTHEKKPFPGESDATLDDGSVHDTKNEKKKPARGEKMWGQGNFVQLKLVNGQNGEASAGTGSDSKATPAKKSKHRHTRPPAKMMRQLTQAVMQWEMIESNDRLLLGLSGGKDSLSLLHCLMECQRKMPIKFEIEVCTIDPMTPSFDPSPLIPYVESLGLKYHYIRDDIVGRANTAGKDGKVVSSLCSYCARMKRGNLYNCARRNNCNKLVLAQHLDDCAESFLMSVMHNGFLRTMKAHYKIDAGDLAVIRPLVYCRESLMTNFAKSANLPVINENCPACFEEPKERARTKKLLSREETLYPNFYDNIRRSLIPLMHDDLSGILRGYTEEAVRKSRKEPHRSGKKNSNKKLKGDDSVTADANDNDARDSPKPSPGNSNKDLSSATEEELLMELAKRKAERFRAPASTKESAGDPTGQVCTLIGGNGTIPCRELME